MDAQESKDPRPVTITDKDLRLMWGLMCTREWPTSMIPEVAHIKSVVSNSLKVEAEDEDI